MEPPGPRCSRPRSLAPPVTPASVATSSLAPASRKSCALRLALWRRRRCRADPRGARLAWAWRPPARTPPPSTQLAPRSRSRRRSPLRLAPSPPRWPRANQRSPRILRRRPPSGQCLTGDAAAAGCRGTCVLFRRRVWPGWVRPAAAAHPPQRREPWRAQSRRSSRPRARRRRPIATSRVVAADLDVPLPNAAVPAPPPSAPEPRAATAPPAARSRCRLPRNLTKRPSVARSPPTHGGREEGRLALPLRAAGAVLPRRRTPARQLQADRSQQVTLDVTRSVSTGAPRRCG